MMVRFKDYSVPLLHKLAGTGDKTHAAGFGDVSKRWQLAWDLPFSENTGICHNLGDRKFWYVSLCRYDDLHCGFGCSSENLFTLRLRKGMMGISPRHAIFSLAFKFRTCFSCFENTTVQLPMATLHVSQVFHSFGLSIRQFILTPA